MDLGVFWGVWGLWFVGLVIGDLGFRGIRDVRSRFLDLAIFGYGRVGLPALFQVDFVRDLCTLSRPSAEVAGAAMHKP